jgi:PilZ domain-containing protein
LGAHTDVRFIGPVMGRYTLASRARLSEPQVFALRLQSISPITMVASGPVNGQIGEAVTAHYQPFGHVRGKIARHVEGGFVVDIDPEPKYQSKLAARIRWFKRRTFDGLPEKRTHTRFMPREPKSALVLHDGTVLPCLVIDLSCSGAAVSADHNPFIGEPLAIGKMVCRVVRALDVGFAVRFVTEIDREHVEEAVRAPDEWERAMRARYGEDLAPAREPIAKPPEPTDYSI